MDAEAFLRSTPPEINWKIDAWNESQARNDRDIYELGTLVFLAQNNPKHFPKSLSKFRPSRIIEKSDARKRQAMKEEGAKIGMRVPV
jgi:hypothetical protein